MPRAKRTDIRRMHVMLAKEDLAKLEFYFGRAAGGVSEAIRIAVARFLRDHEAKAQEILKGEPQS